MVLYVLCNEHQFSRLIKTAEFPRLNMVSISWRHLLRLGRIRSSPPALPPTHQIDQSQAPVHLRDRCRQLNFLDLTITLGDNLQDLPWIHTQQSLHVTGGCELSLPDYAWNMILLQVWVSAKGKGKYGLQKKLYTFFCWWWEKIFFFWEVVGSYMGRNPWESDLFWLLQTS